jgi:hypothetical protein
VAREAPTIDWMIACITGGKTALPIIMILLRPVLEAMVVRETHRATQFLHLKHSQQVHYLPK